jgi:prevent-host-death family protein
MGFARKSVAYAPLECATHMGACRGVAGSPQATQIDQVMERIATSKARKDFRNVVRRAAHQGKRVKITHYGKTLVALVPAKDLATLEDCEDRNARGRKRTPRKR